MVVELFCKCKPSFITSSRVRFFTRFVHLLLFLFLQLQYYDWFWIPHTSGLTKTFSESTPFLRSVTRSQKHAFRLNFQKHFATNCRCQTLPRHFTELRSCNNFFVVHPELLKEFSFATFDDRISQFIFTVCFDRPPQMFFYYKLVLPLTCQIPCGD